MTKTPDSRSLDTHQRIGFLLIVLLFVGLGGWAAIASISGAVIGQARVVVETSPKKVQHLDGGVVAEILVRDGAHVEAGQILLRLDDTETRANLDIVIAALDELIARQARLEAERDKAIEIAFPTDITDRLDNRAVRTAHTGQRNLFVARRDAKAGEQAQLRSKIGQLDEEIVGFQAQQAAKERQIDLLKGELASLQGLKEQGLVRQNRILPLERDVARLEGEHGNLISQIAGNRGQISETQLRILQVEKDQLSEIASELRDTEGKINETREKRIVMSARLKRTEIRAPRSGMVHQIAVHTIGGVVSAGEQIMLIIPEQDDLIFEARIRPMDIDQVRRGQKATVRVHAFDPALAPELAGEVDVIAPDTILDTTTNTQYYVVRIKVGKSELGKMGQRFLVPGMMADAFIETESRTVLTYLSKPIADRVAHVFRER